MTHSTGIRKLTRWVTVETESAFGQFRKRRQRTRMYVYENIFYCSLYDCTERRVVDISDEYGLCHDHVLETVAAAPRAINAKHLIDRINRITEESAARRDAILEDEKRRRKMRDSGWIYYIKVDDLIKIGYATILIDRLRQYPPNITVLAVHPGTRELETFLHRKFRLHLKQGREWYTDDPVLHAHINDVVATYGKPEEEHHYLTEYGLVDADTTRIAS